MGHKVDIPCFAQKIIDGEISYEKYLAAKEKDGDILLREGEETNLIIRHWNCIKNSEAILVLNLNKKGINNYIVGNTLMEMGFAYGHGKKIFLFNPIPERSERMHYVDELLDMKLIVINGDLTKLI